MSDPTSGYAEAVERRTGAVGAAIVAAVVLAGMVTLAALALSNDDDAQPIRVDERRGILHGVRMGDSESSVRALRGEPTDDGQGFFPAGADYTGPPAIPSPQSDQLRLPRPPSSLHYDRTAYLVSPSQGVYSMATLEEGARTHAGVGVGGDLEDVRQRYERVKCGEAVAGEPLFGGETPKYPWCRAVVGEVRVFFGDDPIESITLTRYAM